MIPQWFIETKRDGHEHAEADLREWVRGVADGTLPDYQIAAWLMAVYLNGLNETETAILTDAMMRSGDCLSWDLSIPTVDKHSTGGVGDKISLPLAPVCAALGLAVPMISGRGLGLTGGTLDKLESIPGFNVRLSVEDFRCLVAEVGCCLIGQTDSLAPADRRLYALRDVTATVPSIPLITASIMSKKLAEGAHCLLFDVKFGSGAFMRTQADAHRLADSLIATGRRLGRVCHALITDMDQPLGRTVGNALEVQESLEILQGRGPWDVRALVIEEAAHMALSAGLFPWPSSGKWSLLRAVVRTSLCRRPRSVCPCRPRVADTSLMSMPRPLAVLPSSSVPVASRSPTPRILPRAWIVFCNKVTVLSPANRFVSFAPTRKNVPRLSSKKRAPRLPSPRPNRPNVSSLLRLLSLKSTTNR